MQRTQGDIACSEARRFQAYHQKHGGCGAECGAKKSKHKGNGSGKSSGDAKKAPEFEVCALSMASAWLHVVHNAYAKPKVKRGLRWPPTEEASVGSDHHSLRLLADTWEFQKKGALIQYGS